MLSNPTLNAFMETIQSKLPDEINFADAMNKETKDVLDYNVWVETIELQKSFNDSVAPGWQLDVQNKKYDFWMAVLDETIEVMNSKHWKWWKDKEKMGQVDWENVRVEMVDLFHFLLSLAIQNESEHILYMQLLNLELTKEENAPVKDDDYFEHFHDQFLMGVQMKALPLVLVRWVEFWYRLGANAEDLLREYRVKNALNKVRQKYGYNKGQYHKMWVDSDTNKRVEDNVIAWKLAEKLPLEPGMMEKLEKELSDYYAKYMYI
jgi:dimeric dUTPase (all-alpha-NTP-PPase superfamily)